MLPVEHAPCGTAIVSLTPNPIKPRGGVVVLDGWLIDEIAMTLDALAASAPQGVILRSVSERVFVAGADLAEIDALDDRALDAYLRRGADAFAMFHMLPCPTAAIVHRAALGGGLEIAMHCDAIIGVVPSPSDKPWRIGLPECGLGICPGWGGTVMYPARVDPTTAIVQTATGETNPVTTVPQGLFDATVAAGNDPIHAALTWLVAHPRDHGRRTPKSIGPQDAPRVTAALANARAAVPASDAANAVFRCVEAGIASGFSRAVAEERRSLIALRHTPQARAKLAQFLAPKA
ncbi:MAG: hypothetical protein EXS03_08480 [Phycisphaerales bacterium]|nr:hypothetical protein [Phycisphaerales bacterium]